jgi:hypothetical protein
VDPVESARGGHLIDDMTAVLDDVGSQRAVDVQPRRAARWLAGAMTRLLLDPPD